MSATATPHSTRPKQHPHLVAWSLVAALLTAGIGVLLVNHGSLQGSSTVVGSGVPATQARSLPVFSSIDMTGFSSLNYRVGPRQSVVVRADSNVVSRITTQVTSGQLVVSNKVGSYSIRTPVSVTVTAPSVGYLALAGTGDITVTGLHQRQLTMSLAGLGTIEASGTVATLHVAISGEAQAQLARLTARDATAVITGTGQIQLRATHRLNAMVSGDGVITYLGTPRHVTTHITGAGQLIPG